MGLDMPPCIFRLTNSVIPFRKAPTITSESDHVGKTNTSPDRLTFPPRGHNRDVHRFPEISLAGGSTLKETSNHVSSSQFHGQADRDTQPCRCRDSQKTPLDDQESHPIAPKAKRHRRRSRKPRQVREDVDIQEDEARRGDSMQNPSQHNMRRLDSGLLPFPVHPWPYYPPPFIISIPVTVVPIAPMMVGPSRFTNTNIDSGNVTNIHMYDVGNNNSRHLEVRKGGVFLCSE